MIRRYVQIEYEVVHARTVNVRFHVVIQRADFVAVVDAGIEHIGHSEQFAHIEVVRFQQRGIPSGFVILK